MIHTIRFALVTSSFAFLASMGALACGGTSHGTAQREDAAAPSDAASSLDANVATDAADAATVIDEEPPSDAAILGDASDAGGAIACDRTKPFGSPVALPLAPISSTSEDSFALSPDGLTAYIASTRATDGGSPDLLYIATRPSSAAAFTFSSPSNAISAVASGYGISNPTVTADGLTIYFSNGSYGNYDIWTSTRASSMVDFPAPSLVAAPINQGGGGAGEDNVGWVSPDGNRIYFMSNRSGGRDIWFATRAGAGGFGAPVNLAAVSSTDEDDSVVLTPDELQIFIDRERKVYYASRAHVGDVFSTPVAVSELNALATSVDPAWVSADGCTLYFTAEMPNATTHGAHVWSATRSP